MAYEPDPPEDDWATSRGENHEIRKETKTEKCPECGDVNWASNGWCITCRYGDKPYH